jgi:hypothetical protein
MTKSELALQGFSEDELAELGTELTDEERAALGVESEADEDGTSEETGTEPTPTPTDDEGAAGLTSEAEEEPAPEATERDGKGRFRKASDRIRELNDARKAAEAKALELEQRLAALEQAKAEPKEPEPPPADPLAEIKAQKKALAAKYNAGEIDFEELEAARDELEDQRLAIVMQRNRPDPIAMQRQAEVQGQINVLAEEHAWFDGLSEADRHDAVERAKTRAAKDGLIGPDFHLAVVKYAIDTAIRYDLAPAGVASPLSSQPAAKPTRKPLLTEEKRALARSHPPDLNAAPAPQKSTDAITLADVQKMSEADILRLPKPVLDRLYAEAGM